MPNSTVRAKKTWWGALNLSLGLCLSLLNAPAFDANAATLSTVFALDLHVTSAGVVAGTGSNQEYLFGTTSDTSLSYGGSIYKVPTAGGAPQVIYQLRDIDGYSPQASLLVGTDGYLYGTTHYGPRSGAVTTSGTGTVFRVAQDGTGFTTLHTFDNVTGIHSATGAGLNVGGIYPDYALIQDATYVYGVTRFGGINGSGTVFRVRKSDGVFDVLHSFTAVDATTGTNSDGSTPSSSLTLGSDGRLYGVTVGGGANVKTATAADGTTVVSTGTGTLFSLAIDGTSFLPLYSFSALDDTTAGVGTNGDGVQPQGGLLEVSPGVFLGTASDGGTPADTSLRGLGTVFQFDVGASQLTTLHNFDNTTGATPIGNLLLASNGLVYGVTNTGSSISDPVTVYGVIYSIDPTTTDFELVQASTFALGTGFNGGLIQASDGDLYGSVVSGNACTAINGNGYGAVLRYSLTTNASSSGYANCTAFNNDSGGGAMSPGLWWLLALGLAPPVRRRLFGVR